MVKEEIQGGFTKKKKKILPINYIEVGGCLGVCVLETTAVNGWYLFPEETKQEVLKTVTVTRRL